MIDADRTAFLEVVIGFAELKGKSLSAPALELYWRALQDWELEDFKIAAVHLLKSCEFMPMPKDFENLRRAGRMTAGEAWGEVLECARRGDPPPQDALLRRALRAIGGINAVMMSETDKTCFLEQRFCEHYETMRESDDIRDAVPEIAGETRRRMDGPHRLLGSDND